MFVNHTPPKVNIKGYKINDCTVNALGNGLGISYNLARKILQTVEHDNFSESSERLHFRKKNPFKKSEFSIEHNVHGVCSRLSSEFIDLRRNRTAPRFTLEEFARKNPKGRYIVLVTGHLTTVIEGVVYDTWNCGSKNIQCIYVMDLKYSKEKIKELAKFYKMDNEKHMKDHMKKYNLKNYN